MPTFILLLLLFCLPTFIHAQSDSAVKKSSQLREIGQYLEGKKQGLWRLYYDNGTMADSTTYAAGIPVGTTLSWNYMGQLTDSIEWHEHFGYGFAWFLQRYVSIGQYDLDRKKNGSWKYYFANGKPSSSEVYAQDSLVSIQYFDETGQKLLGENAPIKTEIESTYPGGAPAWQQYLMKNIRYPAAAVKRNIEGAVVTQFIVDENGNVQNVEAIAGPVELRSEAERLIRRSRQWIPAVYHGIKVKSYKKQPIIFRAAR